MELTKTEEGFIKAVPTPSNEELRAFYNNMYFGADNVDYQESYTDTEVLHKLIAPREAEKIYGGLPKNLLDVGCGEGFFLRYFREKGTHCRGIDFTDSGIKSFNPELISNLAVGNIFDLLDSEIRNENKYDMISCNNVLEHVADPHLLLAELKKIVSPKGVLVITVPNDFSLIQNTAVTEGKAPENFFVCYPEHLNYFNTENLKRVIESSGLTIHEMTSNFPIDLFMLNDDSNFIADRTKGKNCHRARVSIENAIISKNGINALIAFRKGCVAAGIGRNITVYCKKS